MIDSVEKQEAEIIEKMSKEEAEYKELLRAVEGGNNEAKTKLAWYKLSGCGGAEVDKEGAVALLEERVKDKDVEAMWMLGLCYEYGMGVEQDLERAEELYEESSDGKSVIGEFLAEHGRNERGSGKMDVQQCMQ